MGVRAIAREGARNVPRRTLNLAGACGGVVVAASFALACEARRPDLAWVAATYVVLAIAGTAGAAICWNSRDPRLVMIALGCGLLARAALFASPPLFSHDAYRYEWDAQLILHHLDPLAIAPNAPAAAALRATPLYVFIDYRSIPSLYPPFAYALFVAGASLHMGVYGEKLVMLAGDLAALAALYALLASRGLPPGRATLYAWSPLVLLEFAQNGHLEGWAIAALLAAFVALELRHITVAALALAGAVLTKLYPLAFVPIYFARTPGAAASVALVCALAYAPLLFAGIPIAGSLGTYVNGEQFNESVFMLVGTRGAALLLLATVITLTYARRRGCDAVLAIVAAEFAYLLLTPNVLPWYVTVFPALLPAAGMPIAAKNDAARAAAWRFACFGLVGWSLTVPLAYGAPKLYPGGSLLDFSVRAFEYLPLLAAAFAIARLRLVGVRSLLLRS